LKKAAKNKAYRWVFSNPKHIGLFVFFSALILGFQNCRQGVNIAGSTQLASTLGRPSPPRLTIGDRTSGSQQYSKEAVVNTIISGDAGVSRWCLTEDPIFIAASAKGVCPGGQGPTDGWYEARPDTSVLSSADGNKEVFLWVQYSDSALQPASAKSSIFLDQSKPVITPPAAVSLYSKVNTFSLAYTVSETGSGVLEQKCQLDGGPFAPCTSPVSYTALAEAAHSFKLQVTDKAGNLSEYSHAWRVDMTAPSVLITTSPNNPTNQQNPAFSFSGSDAGAGIASFECQLDNGGFAPCTSPKPYANLAEGPHTFAVRSIDNAGNMSALSTFTWQIILTAPTLTISAMPTNPTNNSAATFAFSAVGTGAVTFECGLDGAALTSCQSPKTYSGLANGTHSFIVKTTDSIGNFSQKTQAWLIDTVAPTISIVTAPSGNVTTAAVSLAFSATDGGSGVRTTECSLDGSAFTACTSPKAYTLADGFHQFSVRAVDNAGNVSSTAQAQWTIDSSPPSVTIASGPSTVTNTTSASFAFSASDAGSGLAGTECALDGSAFASCTSPKNHAGLANGAHVFSLRARDNAGNLSNIQNYSWTIDTAPPAVTIASGPAPVSESAAAAFTFSGNDSGSGVAALECSLDGASFSTCVSPKAYSGLGDGDHLFQLRARDFAGNVSTTVSHSWSNIAGVVPLASAIGNQYNCTLPSRSGVNPGNVGYDYTQDEQDYAHARLINEKGCFSGGPKLITFLISTVNFPMGGVASGVGADAEQSWLDYWDKTTRKWGALGFKIILLPLPYIINETPVMGTAPGLRALKKSDLNMAPGEIPVVGLCRDNNAETRLASPYDSRTLAMGNKFHQGVASFFNRYPEVEQVYINGVSIFGGFGFPQPLDGAWWAGPNQVWTDGCWATGDQFARQIVLTNPPTQSAYGDVLRNFRAQVVAAVKPMFPGKKFVYMIDGPNDDNPRTGELYPDAARYASANGMEVHSSALTGNAWNDIPLGKIASGLSPGVPYSMENGPNPQGEHDAMRNIFFGSYYKASWIQAYAQYQFDEFYLNNLHYSVAAPPSTSGVPNKLMKFVDFKGLGSLKSDLFKVGFMDAPQDGATINGDVFNSIGGWGFYEAPYGDNQIYGVHVYAGQLTDTEPFPFGNPDGTTTYMYPYPADRSPERSIQGRHPQFMRLVANTVTSAARAAGGADTSRFGAGWKPNLSSGKAVMRVFFVNGNAEVIAEHPQSPMILNVNSKVTGKFTIARRNFSYDNATSMCTRDYTIAGTATLTTGGIVDIFILDEYRGRILAKGKTNSSGTFSIDLTVAKTPGEETQYAVFRAYAYLDNDGDGAKELVGMPLDLQSHPFQVTYGYNTSTNTFQTIMGCN
jgi:hypothetical protein